MSRTAQRRYIDATPTVIAVHAVVRRLATDTLTQTTTTTVVNLLDAITIGLNAVAPAATDSLDAHIVYGHIKRETTQTLLWHRSRLARATAYPATGLRITITDVGHQALQALRYASYTTHDTRHRDLATLIESITWSHA